MVVYAPLIVGITGKRDLQGKDAVVGKAFRELFELLDRKFSHAPKILVSALAQGADTIAAEEALAHAERQRTAGPPTCAWQVVAVLPMPIEQYAEDFDPEGAAKLRDLCGRLRTEVLDPLLRPEAGSRFALGAPFAWAELSRGNGSSHRTAHYEQVGLHISDQCGLLIAVMPRGERPDKIGGTARIVDYRVRAALDDARRDIIRRSQVLAPLPLDRSQPGPAWVIDLDGLDPAKETQLDAVELWEPVAREEDEETKDTSHSGEIGNRPGETNHLAEARNHSVEIRKTRLTSIWHDFDRLWLATAIETFNSKLSRQQQGEAHALPADGDASSILRHLRHALSFVQGREKGYLTNTARGLAGLFVAAIIMLELHIEFEFWWAIACYALLFLIILVLYGYARSRRYQQHTEDYRAVSEALRVQLVWWDAGLSGREHRVDRTYLGATGGSLGRVRTAVRHLIDSALLMAGAPQPVDGAAEKWITGQIKFFRARIRERHASLSFVEDLAWFLFVGSFGISLFVAALALCEHKTISVLQSALPLYLPSIFLLLSVLIAVGLFIAQRRLISLARGALLPARLRLAVKILNMLPAIAAGLVVSAGLYDAAVLSKPWGWEFAACPADFTHKLTLITMVGAAAWAGAIRYYAEKMSEEHELFSYRDALVTFTRAQEELAEVASDASEAGRTRRRDILLAIGQEALEENEAWIRAHRLRPLEPVVGG